MGLLDIINNAMENGKNNEQEAYEWASYQTPERICQKIASQNMLFSPYILTGYKKALDECFSTYSENQLIAFYWDMDAIYSVGGRGGANGKMVMSTLRQLLRKHGIDIGDEFR